MHNTTIDGANLNGAGGQYAEAHDIEVPILIIGGGPTGLLLAFILSRLGGESN